MKLETESSFRVIVEEEKEWFIEQNTSQAELIEIYSRVIEAINDHDDLLSAGNTRRLNTYCAQQAAIEELVPDIVQLVENQGK